MICTHRPDSTPCALGPAEAGGRLPRIDARQVHARLDDTREWAFLDVREQGAHDQGHPFWATNAPLSHFDEVVPQCVPRVSTPVVLMDDDDGGLAGRAGEWLSRRGYRDVQIMERGLQGWREAGLAVHPGVHVPSKAFGEFVEHADGTPSIDLAQLKAWVAQGRDFLLIDCRPFEEYRISSLPGSINCPGMELLSRAFDLPVQPDTPIVVHCAGRTRGIIATQSLVQAGLPNPVVSLRNGLADWYLDGEPFALQNDRVASPPTVDGLDRARRVARETARKWGVRFIDTRRLDELQADLARTLYLFDVRSPEEYEAGHLPAARHAPGGQLLQALDSYVATRGARIVLFDDTGVRACMTAAWLVRMGWTEVFVLEGAGHRAGAPMVRGTRQPLAPEDGGGQAEATIGAAELGVRLQEPGVVVLDLSSSLQYRKAHIPGAWFAVRARLDEALTRVPGHRQLVLTCADGQFARRALADAQALCAAPVVVLRGGNAAWAHAGLPLATGPQQLTTTPDDVWYSPLDRPDPQGAVRGYLQWEIALMESVRGERGVNFLSAPVAPADPVSPPQEAP